MKTTHTPLPWRTVSYSGNDGRGVEIHTCGDTLTYPVARIIDHDPDIEMLEADAAFIVLACNSHYELLAALESAAESIEQLVKVGRIPANNAGLRDARAAIAKAKAVSGQRTRRW